jgi:membrane-bound lytic murein transglycosylase MltF
MLGVFQKPACALAMATLVASECASGRMSEARQSELSLQQATTSNRVDSSESLQLPIRFERRVGDLDQMLKRHEIRALVVPSRSGFFYDKGIPEGIYYEAFNAFQRFVNQKFKTGDLETTVTYIPVRPEQLEKALLEGVGDVVAYGVIVTPDREQKVLFTIPIERDVKEVIVTGPKAPAISSLEDLSGKEVYANPLTDYYENLKKLSESFQKAGKPAIQLKSADANLTDEDLMQMVSAGLIPATVTINIRAAFWSKVLPHLIAHQDIVLKGEGELACATRKDSPRLSQALDEFLRSRDMGTSFGNTLVRRYLENESWVKDATSNEEMRKFRLYVSYFKKFADEYDFDYLLLVALAYQESLLDQNRRNPSGAVGIMQVIPKYAAAAPINISDVEIARNNIEAGAKMLHNILQTYFDDPKLDALNRTLMTFAAYNAGPSRIVGLRKLAASEGLDPNQWFGNVELMAAKQIGQETVQYISNIYKYYVAYKLTLQETHP